VFTSSHTKVRPSRRTHVNRDGTRHTVHHRRPSRSVEERNALREQSWN
jgi:hypothetical protein